MSIVIASGLDQSPKHVTQVNLQSTANSTHRRIPSSIQRTSITIDHKQPSSTSFMSDDSHRKLSHRKLPPPHHQGTKPQNHPHLNTSLEPPSEATHIFRLPRNSFSQSSPPPPRIMANNPKHCFNYALPPSTLQPPNVLRKH